MRLARSCWLQRVGRASAPEPTGHEVGRGGMLAQRRVRRPGRIRASRLDVAARRAARGLLSHAPDMEDVVMGMAGPGAAVDMPGSLVIDDHFPPIIERRGHVGGAHVVVRVEPM